MAILDNIEVRIKCDGEILAEYDDPDEDAPHDTRTTTKFIEATPGAKFNLEVSIMPGYSFLGTDGVYISRRMDGQRCNPSMISKSPRDASVTHSFTKKIDSDTQFDDESGQWLKSWFTFGQVEILEHSELPDDLDPQMAMELGTIELACYRVHRETRRVHQSTPKTPLFTSVDRISEELLKGKDIENNIRYVDALVVPPPSFGTDALVVADASCGLPPVFKFHYRSRRALQILGCIPRSESPAVEIQDTEEGEAETSTVSAISNPNDFESGLSQRARERIRLQAELARLDRLDREAYRAQVDADPDNSLGEEHVGPSLKREHEGNGAHIEQEGSGSGKRVRTSRPNEQNVVPTLKREHEESSVPVKKEASGSDNRVRRALPAESFEQTVGLIMERERAEDVVHIKLEKSGQRIRRPRWVQTLEGKVVRNLKREREEIDVHIKRETRSCKRARTSRLVEAIERSAVPNLKREYIGNNVHIKQEQSSPRKRGRTSRPVEEIEHNVVPNLKREHEGNSVHVKQEKSLARKCGRTSRPVEDIEQNVVPTLKCEHEGDGVHIKRETRSGKRARTS